jgi:hypothetical protein
MRYRLHSLLIVVTVLCVGFALIGNGVGLAILVLGPLAGGFCEGVQQWRN